MSQRVNLSLFLIVIGCFVCAVALGLAAGVGRSTGVLLSVAGAASIAFSRRLALAQQELATKPFIPSHWQKVRPFTFVLWGAGVMIVGLAQLVLV